MAAVLRHHISPFCKFSLHQILQTNTSFSFPFVTFVRWLFHWDSSSPSDTWPVSCCCSSFWCSSVISLFWLAKFLNLVMNSLLARAPSFLGQNSFATWRFCIRSMKKKRQIMIHVIFFYLCYDFQVESSSYFTYQISLFADKENTSPPGVMGVISRFSWTFQCRTCWLAFLSFSWTSWNQNIKEGALIRGFY